jgi:hypothetical protein
MAACTGWGTEFFFIIIERPVGCVCRTPAGCTGYGAKVVSDVFKKLFKSPAEAGPH